MPAVANRPDLIAAFTRGLAATHVRAAVDDAVGAIVDVEVGGAELRSVRCEVGRSLLESQLEVILPALEHRDVRGDVVRLRIVGGVVQLDDGDVGLAPTALDEERGVWRVVLNEPEPFEELRGAAVPTSREGRSPKEIVWPSPCSRLTVERPSSSSAGAMEPDWNAWTKR